MLGLEVVRKIADGSAVEAFLARSQVGQVLVQVSRPEVSRDPEIYGEFLDWTKIATQLKHPGLLTVEHTHHGADGRFLVMTGPVSGRTAEQLLRSHGPLAPEEALRWALRLSEALEYLHSHQLVHGFLSPANVFLDGENDRPLVRLLDTGFLLFRATKSMSTRQSVVPPEYLSPERAAGQRATAADDVYGFGVLFYELLTGKPPFTGATPQQVRALHKSAPVPELPAHLGAWRPLLEGCLGKYAQTRFASMGAVREAIAALSSNGEATPVIQGVATADDSGAEEPLTTLMEPAPDELRQGSFLGPYEILGVLGEGGMGRVFVAQHRTLGRRVAIKVLRRELGAGTAATAMARRFVQEAQAVNRVRHPNIVQVFDLVQETPQDGGRTWFVMELLEGQSFKTLGKAAPVELPRVVRFLRQAAEALAAAHAVGVVHRDVKPDNLFVTADHQLKVLDFGVAQVSQPQGIPRTTMAGQVVGTPLWMAPEQILGRDVDARVDVYGLATVAYVMLLRRFPFDGVAMADVVMQRLQHEARPLGSSTFLGEPVPHSLAQLLAACLSRDVSHRPWMAEVASRLQQIERELAGVGAAAGPSVEVDLEPGHEPSPRWVPWALATIGLGSALALAWQALRG